MSHSHLNNVRFYAGTDFDPKDTPENIVKAIAGSGTAFELIYTPVYTGEFKKTLFEGKHCLEAVTSDGEKHKIDIFGSQRESYQNIEMVDFFQRIAGHYDGLKLEMIAFNGFDIFASIKLPIEINPKKVGDITETSLLVYEPRKADQGMKFNTYYNRLVCLNGMTNRVKVGSTVIDHRNGINMTNVDKLITSSIQQARSKEVLLEALTDTPMSIDQAHLLLIQQFGNPEKTLEDQPKIVRTCLELFDGKAEGSEMSTAFQTAAGLLHSVTQYYRGDRGSQESFLQILHGTAGKKINEFQNVLLGVSRM